MDILEAITQRRSVKHYDPTHEMTELEIDQLLDLAMMSPTSFNMQNWRFVLVRDKDLRQEIRNAAWGQAQMTEASLLLILCADLKAWEKSPQQYWRNAPEKVSETMVSMMGSFYQDNSTLQRDEAMRSCGIAAQTIMLAAKAMGYDSCPMIGFDSTKVASLIHLPEDHVIGLCVVVGKTLTPAQPRGGMIEVENAVIVDRFAN